MITLRVVMADRVVLIQVEGYYILERQFAILVQFDKLLVDTHWCTTSSETQHALLPFCVFGVDELLDFICDFTTSLC